MPTSRLRLVAVLALGWTHLGPVLAQDKPPSSTTGVVIRCVDLEGHPVANAEVHVLQRQRDPAGGLVGPIRVFGPSRSDEDGRARCPTALTYDGARFDRRAYGRVRGELVGVARAADWGPENDERAPLHLILCPSREVRGTVSVPEGFSANAVRVRVLSMTAFSGKYSVGESFPRTASYRTRNVLPDIFEANVNERGEFTLGDVPVGGRLYLAAEGEGLGQAQYSTVTAKGVGVHLEMRPEAVVEGTLLAPDGKPVSGAEITVQTRIGSGPPVACEFRGLTDEQGTFRVGGLPRASFDVHADANGEPWALRPLRIAAAPGEKRRLDLRAERGAVVSGVFVDADTGEPISGVGIAATTPEGNHALLARARTDRSGRFEMRVPSGHAWLQLRGTPRAYHVRRPSVLDQNFVLSAGEERRDDLAFELERTR